MVHYKKHIFVPLFIILLLFFTACADTVGDNTRSQEREEDDLTLVAGFSSEDGNPVVGNTVRLSSGGSGTDYALDGDGKLQAAYLPRNGELLLTLFDRQQKVQGAMTLVFDQGAVIDATTGEDGVGHITVRTDADEVALLFDVTESGTLTCTLWLNQAEAPGTDQPRKGTEYGKLSAGYHRRGA